MKIKIETEIEITKLTDLSKLKNIVEANKLDKPNFSKIAREFDVDRRTVKKYYHNEGKKERKTKKTKVDDLKEIIDKLLCSDENTKQIFYYKNHLYRYLVREHNLKYSRSAFNRFILLNKNYSNYFKPKDIANAIKTETKFGNQAQFDWKENLNFYFKDGTNLLINVASLILSASRMKVWAIYVSKNQEYVFDFLAKAFETLGGVPKEILIDNAKTMMDEARTKNNYGKINNKFKQLADDYGFTIKPCLSSRAKTKAKVENPMRIIDEIMNYSGQLNDLSELYDKMKIINDEANARICQATGIAPILAFNKEKEHLLPLPNEKICIVYKIITKKVKVGTDGLINYNQKKYSVPPNLISEKVDIQLIEDNLHIYHKGKLITIHKIYENKKINYLTEHHEKLIEITFPKMEEEQIKEYAIKHLEELEAYNEQISTIKQ